MINAVAQQWQIWLGRPFPAGYNSEEIKGVDLIMLDTYVASCISTFIGNHGKLDQCRVAILQECLSDLDLVVPLLEGEAHSYFAELRDITRHVLTLLN